MTQPWCTALPGGVRLAVQITANAKKTEVTGVQGDVLKLRLQAQPIEGKANQALVKWLAKALGVSRGAVAITHGHTNQRKLIEVKSPTLAVEGVALALNVPTPPYE